MSIDEWVSFGIPDEITEQAAHWIARLDSDQHTDKDYQEFSNWLAQDHVNRLAFEELSEMWARIETLGDQRHKLDESQILEFPMTAEMMEKKVTSNWQPIAAIILISIGLLTPLIERLIS